jgi:hypothetical protein
MDLDKILPKKFKWQVKSDIVMVFKIAWLPIFKINGKEVEIFLDLRTSKQILPIVKNLQDLNVGFYFISPLLANPGYKVFDDEQYHELNIRNLMNNYWKPQYYDGFKKIEFDVIENLINYATKYKCSSLIKDIYEDINEYVQGSGYDWYTNRECFYVERQDIREDFQSLYRQIKITEILNERKGIS